MNVDGAEAWGLYEETSSVKGRVSFESGYHKDTDDVKPDINTGNWNANTWNEAVGKRIGSDVRFLVVDSIHPVATEDLQINTAEEVDYSLEEKKDVLAWDPVRGREMIVVCGDINYKTAASDLTRGVPDASKKNKLMEIGTSKNNSERDELLPQQVTENVVTGAAGFVTAALLVELARREGKNIQIGDPMSKKHMVRRDFLKLSGKAAAVGAALYAGGRGAAGLLTPFAPNEKLHNIGEKILEVTGQPDLFEKHWLDGRTALLIEKADSALNQGLTPPDSKAAVVMGNGHSMEAGRLMESGEARKEAIHVFASDMVTFYDKVLDDFPEINKTWAINRMLDSICQADLVSVTQPESDGITKDRIDAEVRKNVRYLFSFMSPGVRSALSGLYRLDRPETLEDLVQAKIEQPSETSTPVPTPEPTKVPIPKPPGGEKMNVPRIQ